MGEAGNSEKKFSLSIRAEGVTKKGEVGANAGASLGVKFKPGSAELTVKAATDGTVEVSVDGDFTISASKGISAGTSFGVDLDGHMVEGGSVKWQISPALAASFKVDHDAKGTSGSAGIEFNF
jgi:hypothetical protein